MSIEFPIYLGPIDANDPSINKVGTYTIFNDRTTYIRVKINTDSFYDELEEAKHITLKYPSENMKTLRSGIFKLNKVTIN
jgi:hypothetical protein